MDGILLRRKVLPNHSMRKKTSRERGRVAPDFVLGRANWRPRQRMPRGLSDECIA